MERSLASLLVLGLLLGGIGARAADDPGVTPTTIKLGLHVPFTGAGPVDPAVIEAGAALYWKSLHDDRGVLIHGRRVEVEFLDDNSSPSMAAMVCDDLASRSFLLLGLAGPHQVAACGAYASSEGIPYLAPGFHGEADAPKASAYALSAGWRTQSRIMAEYIAREAGLSLDRYRPGCIRLPRNILGLSAGGLIPCEPDGQVVVGLVRSDYASHDEIETVLRDALAADGYDRFRVYTTVKEGNSSDATRIADQMAADGVDVAVVAAGAIFSVILSLRGEQIDYTPTYLFHGGSLFNNAIELACGGGAMDGASIFSPWPAWSAMNAGAFDPHFADAAARHAPDLSHPRQGDQLVALWGLMKSVHRMLDALGPDPTRAQMIGMLDGGYQHATGVSPDFAVDGGDHFGVDAVHRLEASCEDGQFHQADSFITGYPAE